MADGTPIRRDDGTDSADSLPFGAALWAELSAGQGGQRLHAGRQRAAQVGRRRRDILRYGRLRGRDASSEPGDAAFNVWLGELSQSRLRRQPEVDRTCTQTRSVRQSATLCESTQGSVGAPLWIAALLVMAWALLFGAMLLLVWLGRVGLL